MDAPGGAAVLAGGRGGAGCSRCSKISSACSATPPAREQTALRCVGSAAEDPASRKRSGSPPSERCLEVVEAEGGRTPEPAVVALVEGAEEPICGIAPRRAAAPPPARAPRRAVDQVGLPSEGTPRPRAGRAPLGLRGRRLPRPPARGRRARRGWAFRRTTSDVSSRVAAMPSRSSPTARWSTSPRRARAGRARRSR